METHKSPLGFVPVNHTRINRKIRALTPPAASPLAAAREIKSSMDWKRATRPQRRYAIAAALQAYAAGRTLREIVSYRPRYYFNLETQQTIIQ